MNCPKSRDWLQERLDGTPPGDRTALDQHLVGCPECRRLHAAAHFFDEGLRLLDLPTPPLDLTSRIVTRVLSDQRARHLRRRLLTAFALAASLLLAAVGGYFW